MTKIPDRTANTTRTVSQAGKAKKDRLAKALRHNLLRRKAAGTATKKSNA